jgi:hypothetical protein
MVGIPVAMLLSTHTATARTLGKNGIVYFARTRRCSDRSQHVCRYLAVDANDLGLSNGLFITFSLLITSCEDQRRRTAIYDLNCSF